MVIEASTANEHWLFRAPGEELGNRLGGGVVPYVSAHGVVRVELDLC